MCQGLFIVGTDTDVGKTYQTVRLAQSLRAKNLRVGCYKPVASGFSREAWDSDVSLLAQACGVERDLLGRVCPQSFYAPLAPPVSAALEGKQVDEALLRDGAVWWKAHCDFLLVEGAGGVMSPISQSLTVIDLAVQLAFPLVLVVANRLGCVGQTLLAAEALQRRNLRLEAIVLNTRASESGFNQLELSNLQLIQQFLPYIPIVLDASDLADGRLFG